MKFLTHMLSLILRTIFINGQKKFLWSFWDHFLASTAILYKIFSFRYRTLKIIKHFDFFTQMLWPLCACWAYDSGTDACTERACQELMRALSVRVKKWCAPWPYASVPYAHSQHVDQFFHFSNVPFVYSQHAGKELMCALSMRVRNWCIHWAFASGTDACVEHTSQELVWAVSIRIRNWCMKWACASGIDECTVLTRQELIRTLSMRIRN